jgi:flavin reductase
VSHTRQAEPAAATDCFVRGVTLVATDAGGRLRGMTADSFTVVSTDPPLVLVAVRRGSTMLNHIRAAGCFAASVLADHQADVARWFASRKRPVVGQFDLVSWRPGPATGAPVLDDALAFVDCRTDQVLVAGDHELVLGEVLASGRNSGQSEPLVRFRRDYARLIQAIPADAAS